jgi:hypothetical protein
MAGFLFRWSEYIGGLLVLALIILIPALIGGAIIYFRPAQVTDTPTPRSTVGVLIPPPMESAQDVWDNT